MKEQDFTKRLIIVVRKDLASWQIANTVAHIAAYIGRELGDELTSGDVFTTKDGKNYPRNSQYPIIIKGAGSSEQLHTVLDKAREGGFLYLAFFRHMIETSNDEEIVTELATINDGEVELLGIGVFGENEAMGTLTKKFGLWS